MYHWILGFFFFLVLFLFETGLKIGQTRLKLRSSASVSEVPWMTGVHQYSWLLHFLSTCDLSPTAATPTHQYCPQSHFAEEQNSRLREIYELTQSHPTLSSTTEMGQWLWHCVIPILVVTPGLWRQWLWHCVILILVGTPELWKGFFTIQDRDLSTLMGKPSSL